MFALQEFASEAFARTNTEETLIAAPAGPFGVTIGNPIIPVSLTVDDFDGESAVLRLVSGALPAGVTADQVLPFTSTVSFIVNLSGTPAAVGFYTATFGASDGFETEEEVTLSWTVTNASIPGISKIISTIAPHRMIRGGRVAGRSRNGRF